MKNKLLILLFGIFMFVGMNNVFATTFDSTCASQAKDQESCDKCSGSYWYGPSKECKKDYCAVPDNENTPCGKRGQNCSTTDDGSCIMSDYAKSSYATATSTGDHDYGSCNKIKSPSICTNSKQNGGYSCVWIDADEQIYKNRGITTSYCNTNDLVYVSCGDIKDIPRQAPKVFSVVLSVFYLGVPVVLIISSIITLVGAISSGSEDGLSKAKGKLFKKMIAAILTFLVVGIVKFGISLVPVEEGGVDSSTLSSCLNCFLNNSCSNAYFKTQVDGEWVETYLSELK